jgi:hypothetical protein
LTANDGQLQHVEAASAQSEWKLQSCGVLPVPLLPLSSSPPAPNESSLLAMGHPARESTKRRQLIDRTIPP